MIGGSKNKKNISGSNVTALSNLSDPDRNAINPVTPPNNINVDDSCTYFDLKYLNNNAIKYPMTRSATNKRYRNESFSSSSFTTQIGKSCSFDILTLVKCVVNNKIKFGHCPVN